MSDTKFTPGPWGFERTDYTHWIGQMRADGRKVSTIVCSIDTDPEYREDARARRLGDAHLIAAAPDLYEALAGLLEVHDALGDGQSRSATLARTALARARGETS